jgi:hypothetical protein
VVVGVRKIVHGDGAIGASKGGPQKRMHAARRQPRLTGQG